MAVGNKTNQPASVENFDNTEIEMTKIDFNEKGEIVGEKVNAGKAGLPQVKEEQELQPLDVYINNLPAMIGLEKQEKSGEGR